MRMPIDNAPPTIPPIRAKIRYNVPDILVVRRKEISLQSGRMVVVMCGFRFARHVIFLVFFVPGNCAPGCSQSVSSVPT